MFRKTTKMMKRAVLTNVNRVILGIVAGGSGVVEEGSVIGEVEAVGVDSETEEAAAASVAVEEEAADSGVEITIGEVAEVDSGAAIVAVDSGEETVAAAVTEAVGIAGISEGVAGVEIEVGTEAVSENRGAANAEGVEEAGVDSTKASMANHRRIRKSHSISVLDCKYRYYETIKATNSYILIIRSLFSYVISHHRLCSMSVYCHNIFI